MVKLKTQRIYSCKQFQHRNICCKLWALASSPRDRGADAADARAAGGVASSWLTLDTTRRYLDVLSLLPAGPLPVNSLDVTEDRLVCGGDNHVLHCVSALAV